MELPPLPPEIAPAGSLIIRPPGSPLTLPPLPSNSTPSPGFSPNFFDLELSGESAAAPMEMDMDMKNFLESLFPTVPEAPVPEAAGPSDRGLQFYKDFCKYNPKHYVIDSHGSIPFKTDGTGRYEPVVLKESLSGDEYNIYVVTHTKIGQGYCDINPNIGQGKQNVCMSPSNFADGDQHLKGQLFRNKCPEMLFTKLDEDTGEVFDDRESGVWKCDPYKNQKIINFDTYAKLTGTRETAVSNLQPLTNDGFTDTMVVYSLSNIIKTICEVNDSNKFVLHILACLTPGDISGYGLSEEDSTSAIISLQQIHPSLFTFNSSMPQHWPPPPPPHGHASSPPSIAPPPQDPQIFYPPTGTAGKKRRKKRKTYKLYKKKHLGKKNKSNKTNKKSVRRSKRKLRKRNKKKISNKL